MKRTRSTRHVLRVGPSFRTSAEVAVAILARWRALILRVARQPSTSIVLLIVLTIMDAALCLLAMYLIDLGISLMELWAELARKHLELTL